MARDVHPLGPRRPRLVLFVGASMLGHLVLVTAAGSIAATRGCGGATSAADLAESALELSTIDASNVASNDLPSAIPELPVPPSATPRQERAKREIEDPKTAGQVVELPVPATEERPERARYLAEHDSTVSRETRARAAPGGTDAAAAPASPPASTKGGGAATSGSTAGGGGRPPGGPALAMREEESTPGADGPAPPGEHDGPSGTGSPGVSSGAASGGRPNGLPSLSQLRPSDSALGRALGVPATDYLGDVDEGDETSLNAKKWKFATFFNRVKRSLRDHWHPDVAYRRRDPTGAVYGYKDRLTVVRVELDPAGSLKDVALEKPSGLDFLDDEALGAFRQAQPFLNPPRQLVDAESGLISFRFGFLFEVNGTAAPKVFRYND